MANTPVYNLRYPVLTDDPNVPEDIQNLAEDVEGQLVIINAAAAANLAKRPIVYAQPAQTGSGSLAASATATIATLAVADPGSAYRVVAWATLETGFTPAAGSGTPAQIQVTYDSTVWDTNRIGNSAQGITYVNALDSINILQGQPSVSLTGARTIRLLCRANANPITVATLNYTFVVTVWPI